MRRVKSQLIPDKINRPSQQALGDWFDRMSVISQKNFAQRQGVDRHYYYCYRWRSEGKIA
jgi:hypothetical protein